MANNEYFNLYDNVIINGVSIKNIFQNVIFKEKYFSEPNLFLTDKISDGQTPESLSQYYYNDKNLYWIILISNNIKDYFYDWPLRDEELRSYVDENLVYEIDTITASLQTNETIEEKFIELHGQTGDTYENAQIRFKSELYDNLVIENNSKRTYKYLKPFYVQEFLNDVYGR
jgi:hypothetical protein